MALTTHDARPSGPSIRQRVVGEANGKPTAPAVREALLQISGYAGFPAAHEALDVLSELVTQG
jgi:hypothetical protein